MESLSATPTQVEQSPALASTGEEGRLARWVLAALAGGGAYVILVVVYSQTLWTTPRSRIVVTLTWPVIDAVAFALLIALAPAARRNRARALLWFAAVVVERLVVAGLGVFTHVRLPDVASDVLNALAIAAVLGGWLALRGRRGLAYLGLLVPFIVGVTFGAVWFWIWLGHLPFGGATWIGWMASSGNHALARGYSEYVPTFIAFEMIWLASVVVGARVASALQKADNRRVAAAAEREARRAEQAAAAVPIPIVAADGTRYVPVTAAASTNAMAIAAMILGIVGTSILAVIFGHIALHQIKTDGQRGRGMAIAGLVLGYVEIGFLVAWIIFLAIIIGQNV